MPEEYSRKVVGEALAIIVSMHHTEWAHRLALCPPQRVSHNLDYTHVSAGVRE